MEAGNETQEFRPLPVLSTLYEALWHVWVLRKSITLAILFPVWVSTASELALYAKLLPASQLVAWGVWLVNSVAWCFAAVACHRLILLGPGSVARFGVDGKNRREWKFLFLLWSILLIAIAIVLLLATLFQLVGVVVAGKSESFTTLQPLAILLLPPACLAVFVFIGPLSLVLPAAATDQYLDFAGAISLSKGNRWRLLVILYVLPLLIGLISNLFEHAIGKQVGSIVESLFNWLIVPCEVAILSICYKRLTGM